MVAVSVKVETPAGNPLEVVLPDVGSAIEPAPVHNKVVVAVIVIDVDKIGGTGTWKMEAVAAEQELSLITELIAPELYEKVVGEPQVGVKFENVMFAFVNDPTSAPIQS